MATVLDFVFGQACSSYIISPWYNPRGWLGVNNTIYLSTNQDIYTLDTQTRRQCVQFWELQFNSIHFFINEGKRLSLQEVGFFHPALALIIEIDKSMKTCEWESGVGGWGWVGGWGGGMRAVCKVRKIKPCHKWNSDVIYISSTKRDVSQRFRAHCSCCFVQVIITILCRTAGIWLALS